jgi:hypothetical protein
MGVQVPLRAPSFNIDEKNWHPAWLSDPLSTDEKHGAQTGAEAPDLLAPVRSFDDNSSGIGLCGGRQSRGSWRQIIQAFQCDLGLDAVDEARDGAGEMHKRTLSLGKFICNAG